MVGEGEAESSPASEHAHSGHGDRADALPDRDRSCHHGVHRPGRARNTSSGRCGSFKPPAAAAGWRLAFDPAQLSGQIRHLPDIGVAQDMGKAERALRGRDLDHRGDIDVAMVTSCPRQLR